MNNEYTAIFIKEFFKRLEKQGISYCILRGYEGLPEVAGRDIDVFIENLSDIGQLIEKNIQSLGWNFEQVKNEDGFLTYICTLCEGDDVSVIQLDFWTSLNWRGIPWCSKEEILSDLRYINGFFVVSEGGEAVITLLKEIVGGGRVKEKYYKKIQEMSQREKDKFVACISESMRKKALEIWELSSKGDFGEINRFQKPIKRMLKRKNLFVYLRFSLKRLGLKIKNIIVPRGKLIVFIGPDGSGKTTIINKEAEYLKLFYPNQKIYHMRYNILPELKTGHGFSSMKGKVNGTDEGSKEKKKVKRSFLSVLASWFVVLYYTFEFWLGNFKVFALKRKNTLILYDRYYYDHFMQPTSRDLIYPFRKILLFFVAKPNVVIHLKADAEAVYARKQELSRKEIESQNICISRIIKDIKNAHTIDTTNKTVEKVAQEVFETIYVNLFND